MDAKILVTLFFVTATHAGVIPTQKILQGPSTRTRVVGPDGSVIEAYAPGGKVALDDDVGLAAQDAPFVVASAGFQQTQEALEAKNVVAGEPSVVSEGKIPVTVVTVTEKLVPVATNKLSEDVAQETPVVVTPLSVEVKNVAANTFLQSQNFVNEPTVKVVDVQPDSEEATPPITGAENEPDTEGTSTETETEAVTVKGELDGEYVPDNVEKLYDDGSYRPKHF